MKTKFMYLLLIIVIIFVPSTYAAEECAMDDNIKGRALSADGKREVIYYKNLTAEIRNVETEKKLFEGNNIGGMYVNGTRTNVLFSYADDSTEMRRLKNGEIFCKDSNVSAIKFSKKVACFLYKNGGVAIKDLEDGKTLSEDQDVAAIKFSEKVACFLYKNGGAAIKDLEDGKTLQEDQYAVDVKFTEKSYSFLYFKRKEK